MIMGRFLVSSVISIAFLLGVGCDQSTNARSQAPAFPIIMFPEKISSDCRDGRAKLYDECGDQLQLFTDALAQANAESKVLLVSYGAEWCIWCHVFKAYIEGKTDRFTYTYGNPETDDVWTDTLREKAKDDVSQDAQSLARYVSENFVIVHVEYRYALNGDEAVSQARAWDAYDNNIPYIFSVDQSGVFASAFQHENVEIRREGFDWYRGYDRKKLLEELKSLYAAAAD